MRKKKNDRKKKQYKNLFLNYYIIINYKKYLSSNLIGGNLINIEKKSFTSYYISNLI